MSNVPLTGRRHIEHRGIPRRVPHAEQDDCDRVREAVSLPHWAHRIDTPVLTIRKRGSRMQQGSPSSLCSTSNNDGSRSDLKNGSTALSSSMRLCSNFQRKRTSAYARTCSISCSADTKECDSGSLSLRNRRKKVRMKGCVRLPHWAERI
jgi:hypothetical protein